MSCGGICGESNGRVVHSGNGQDGLAAGTGGGGSARASLVRRVGR